MFDANARYLDKGTLFFAMNNGDLLYCEMLDNCKINPSVMIISTYQKKHEMCLISNGGKFQDGFCFMPYQGYFENGELKNFVDDKVKDMAHSILSRIDSHDTCDGTKIIKPYSSGWVKND